MNYMEIIKMVETISSHFTKFFASSFYKKIDAVVVHNSSYQISLAHSILVNMDNNYTNFNKYDECAI